MRRFALTGCFLAMLPPVTAVAADRRKPLVGSDMLGTIDETWTLESPDTGSKIPGGVRFGVITTGGDAKRIGYIVRCKRMPLPSRG